MSEIQSTAFSWSGQYSGCFQDDADNRILGSNFVKLKDNSVTSCLQTCLKKKMPVIGLQFGTLCFCAKQFRNEGKAIDESKCGIKCPGNTDEKCGGLLTMNIYTANSSGSKTVSKKKKKKKVKTAEQCKHTKAGFGII